MIRTRLLQTLTAKAREIREWRDWDIVAVLEQRDGDPLPKIQYYGCSLACQWDDEHTEYAYSTNGIATGPALANGTHTLKIRLNDANYTQTIRVVFGYPASNDTAQPNCPQLKKVLKFDASKMRGLIYTFNRCFRLQKVCEITGAENILSVTSAFQYCLNLEGDIKINSLKSCTVAGSFAYWCEKLKSIEVSGGGMPLCTAFANFARYCTSLKKITLGKCPLATSLSYFAGGCGELETLDLTGYGAALQRLDYAFYTCGKLQGEITLPDMPLLTEVTQAFRGTSFAKITIGKTPLATAWAYTFSGCEKLRELTLKDASAAANVSFMLDYCTSLEKVDLGGMGKHVTSFQEFAQNTTSLKQKIVFPDLPECTAMVSAFRYSGITGFSCGDCPQLDNIQGVCTGCQDLQDAKFGDCPALTNAYQAFSLCESLREVTINADGGTINYPSTAFSGCFSLQKITGKFKLRADGPSSVAYYNAIFQNCYSLREIPDIFPDGGWTAFRVPAAQFANIFSGCYSLAGTMPDLWTTGQPYYFPGTGSKGNAFTQCFQLTNYNDIPTAWRTNVVIGD